MNDKTKKIAELNDLLRTGMGPDHGTVVITSGIHALHGADQREIFRRVQMFDTFGPDNDPYGERDFGAFDYRGQRIFWKIDYYNQTLDGHSEDPSDPLLTRRFLTILLAAEY